MIPAYQDPFPCNTDEGRDDYAVLIEGRGGNYGNRGDMRHVVARCLTLCASCPIRRDCWAANEGEDWVRRLKAGVEAVRPAAERPCEWCGATMVLRAKQGAKRFCGTRCTQASAKARQGAA